MPRRPRPASRVKPRKEKSVVNVASSSKVQLPPPKVTPKRKLKAVDSEPESEGESDDDDEPSSDSDERSGEEGNDDDSRDSEESDVDVDAPRVAQWVDEEDLEHPETDSDGAPLGKVVGVEDIVSVAYVSPKFEWFIIYFAPYRRPYKIVRHSTTSF